MPDTILVTGGAGFIGSNFVRFLLRTRPAVNVINLDALTYCGNLENLADVEDDPRYRFVKGSICDDGIVSDLVEQCEAVVHFAAESHVDRSILDSRPFIEANVLGTQVVLDAVRRKGGTRMVHISTDEVYGALPLEPRERRFTEETPIAPNSPYAASKAAADLLVLSYCETFGVDAVITRCSNNFGPYHFPEKIIPLFITNLMQGETVPVYGDGLYVRDWIHVEDHCEAVLAVLERGRQGEVYNIGADNEHPNIELTKMLIGILGKDESAIRYVKDRPGHDRRYAIDSAKIRRELGWSPCRSAWPEALEKTVAWYVENESWWRNVRSGAYRAYYEKQYGDR